MLVFGPSVVLFFFFFKHETYLGILILFGQHLHRPSEWQSAREAGQGSERKTLQEQKGHKGAQFSAKAHSDFLGTLQSSYFLISSQSATLIFLKDE